MRPGTYTEQQDGVAAHLETRAECKVVNDVLVYGSPDKKDYGTHLEARMARTTINERFTAQTKTTERRNKNAIPYMELVNVWKQNPTFEVTFEDRKFVIHAADLILNERNPIGRAFNRITRRTSAAKRIKKVMDATKEYAPIVDPPAPRPMD